MTEWGSDAELSVAIQVKMVEVDALVERARILEHELIETLNEIDAGTDMVRGWAAQGGASPGVPV